MFIQDGGLTIRLLTRKDRDLLVKWLSNPVLLAFYEGRDNPHDLSKVNEKFYSGKDDTTRGIIEYGGEKIGYVQFYQLDMATRKKYGCGNEEIIYGMDQFIGETDYWDKGIGQLLVGTMVHFLISRKYAQKITLDPRVTNRRAVNCYEKCGFEKVKILPEHEYHEGEYHDCWLMEYNA
ncbi:GNAT family N-acetyltransferase [Sediminibacillus massiliensis]|uniref:GNAT family N-acetyltransferase n=1 Tax=Sediminibacillus massiliensis TaxID=1926277 RepID=UPI0009887CE3|nr:GNAT family N-acetyltransferase [Sediminibacillus massiliensis]